MRRRAADKAISREAFERRLRAQPSLDAGQQAGIVEQLRRIVENLYVHLPLKQAMHGIDPVQQLRRLQDQVASEPLEEPEFHERVADILRSLRDAHTSYIAPPGSAIVARLPFLVEPFGPLDAPRYLVSKVIEGEFDDAAFTAGVEVLFWNGMPIADAVREHARQARGGRPDSALARAADSLTFRPLGYVPVPLEHWVLVGYRAADGSERELRLPWRFVAPGEGPDPVRPAEAAATALALHPERSVIRRAKKLCFNPRLWRTEQADRSRAALPASPTDGWMSGRFQDNVAARIFTVEGKSYGLMRLWSFDLLDDDGFLDEVIGLLRLLPDNGLVIDLRGNPGGLIWAAERMLQLFTPEPIEPVRFSLRATDLTRAMADAPQNRRLLSPWQRSLHEAAATGELYSQGTPITPPARCNDIGQVYGGPVVAVVDPTTYSAGDLFAAGFVDNRVGAIVSVGQATGAGGANVWRLETLRAALDGTDHALAPLPPGVGFTLSVRRATRIGVSAGMPIEDIGVVGQWRYHMTRRDLLEGNIDLLRFCARLIDAQPVTRLDVAIDGQTLEVTSVNLSRIDVYLDQRPLTSVDTNGRVTIPFPGDPDVIRIEGYQGDVLAQVRMLRNWS